MKNGKQETLLASVFRCAEWNNNDDNDDDDDDDEWMR